MIFLWVLTTAFTQNYLKFANSYEAERLLYKFHSDPAPFYDKWEKYVSPDLEKGWFIKEMSDEPIVDSLLLHDLKHQIYPRRPVLALYYKIANSDNQSIASQFDPLSPDIPFYRLITSVINRNFGESFKIINNIRDFLKDFYFQLFVVGNLTLTIYLTLLLAGVAYFLITFFRYLPVYIYNLGRVLPVPDIFKYIVAAIIIFPVLFWTRNFIIIALVSSIPLLLFASKKERRWARFFLIWILLSIPISYVSNSINKTLQGKNEAGVVYRNLKMDYDPEIKGMKSSIALFANAYIANLKGEWRKAESLYYHLEKIGSEDYVYYNNLGNIRFQLGDYNAAESLYTKAIHLNGGSGIPYQNLGNLYLRQLRFLEASRSFDIARKKGVPQEKKIIDFKPDESKLWMGVFKFDLKFPFILSPYLIVITLIIIFLSFTLGPISRVNFCALCGAPITKGTVISEHDSNLCRGCGIKIKTAKNEETKERIIRRIKNRKESWNRIRGIIFTIILPGFGQTYFGRIFKGLLLNLIPLFSYLLLYLSRPPLITPFWQTPPLTNHLAKALLPLVAIFFVIALIGVISYGPRRES